MSQRLPLPYECSAEGCTTATDGHYCQIHLPLELDASESPDEDDFDDDELFAAIWEYGK